MNVYEDFYEYIADEEKVEIFVYGTLKSTGGKNEILQQVTVNDDFISVSSVEMYPMFVEDSYNFPFPMIVNKPGYGNFIDGELWTVQKSQLNILDAFESSLYKRGSIDVEFENHIYKDVLCYFKNGDMSEEELEKEKLIDIWE